MRPEKPAHGARIQRAHHDTATDRISREYDKGAFDKVAGGLEDERAGLHSAADEGRELRDGEAETRYEKSLGTSQPHFKNFFGYADELAANTKGLEDFNKFMGGLADAGKLGAGVLGYLDPNKAEERNANGAPRSDEDWAGKIIGSVSERLSIVKTSMTQVCAWSDAKKLAESKVPLDDNEQLNLLTGSLQSIAKVAQGVLSQTKGFRELLDQAPTPGVASAIPGLDIFVNALAIFDAIVKLEQADAARTYAAEQKHEYKDRVFAIYEELKAENKSKFKLSTARKSPFKVRGFTLYERTASAQALAEEIIAGPSSKKQRRVAQEYLMQKTGQYVNDKRYTRQAIQVAKSVNNIAASIATLTGVGAAAGASMKTAGAVFGGSQLLFRLGKQSVKDKFKFGHTSDQKESEYKLYIQRLALDMCRARDYSVRLHEAKRDGARRVVALEKKTDKHFHKVSRTIEGTGMTMTEFSRITTSDVFLGTMFQKLKKSR